ncbi:MAG TPA: hypothetical protein VGP61_01430 [Gemmatimonadales bacterium]|jgi:hypothetical protein|nr:hypothetical protein [Gemmatimonadales bacterium]
MTLGSQLLLLIVLAIPVACISWTVTHEDIFREPREWLLRKSETSRYLLQRKFFLVLTCEYCFSHYVALLFLLLFRFTLAYPGWRGYVVGGFSLVWIANVYMSLFGRLRLEIKHERQEIAQAEEALDEEEK